MLREGRRGTERRESNGKEREKKTNETEKCGVPIYSALNNQYKKCSVNKCVNVPS